MMMIFFVLHVVGVDVSIARWRSVSGVASVQLASIFDLDVTYSAPVEAQGRGGIHAHMHLWILSPPTTDGTGSIAVEQ